LGFTYLPPKGGSAAAKAELSFNELEIYAPVHLPG
jgi:hypothetical protein